MGILEFTYREMSHIKYLFYITIENITKPQNRKISNKNAKIIANIPHITHQ